jgi:hypothetical protein
MSSGYNFSNIADYVITEINRRKGNTLEVSKLNCWARVVSGVDNGLILVSNPNIPLFRAAGQEIESLYGSSKTSGTIGKDWDDKPVNTGTDPQIGLPRPVISSFKIDEGSESGISRKASFTITAYTKNQMDVVAKYFLEPGFTIFLEWGWNTVHGVKEISKNVNVDYVTKAMDFVKLNEVRKSTKGHYDCYLGYITGGNISFNGTAWDLSVNLVGYSEMASHLNTSDNSKKIEVTTSKVDAASKFKNIKNTENESIGRARFKMMFNELPNIRRTELNKQLLDNPDIANPVNFINFDDKISSKISNGDASIKTIFKRLVGLDKKEVQGEAIPQNINILSDGRFIRFGVLMKILNNNGVNSMTLGNIDVNMFINTENTPISAFEKIFSTDKSKLIIPNTNTPEFSIEDIKTLGRLNPDGETTDCSITDDVGTIIRFPQLIDIRNGKTKNFKGDDIFLGGTDTDTDVLLNKNKNEWGYLDDLYVNFDFAFDILNSSKITTKDALYQILNGMSSAVNGYWNFQIQEFPSDDTNIVELKVIDLNFKGKLDRGRVSCNFDLYGLNSVFIDSNLTMDIPGSVTNQIVGNRLGASINPSNQTVLSNLFSTNISDKILNAINITSDGDTPADNQQQSSDTDSFDKDEEEKNLEEFFKRCGIYPKVTINENSEIGSIDTSTYFIAYDDKNLFNSLKIESDRKYEKDIQEVSIPLPIGFSFTIHGISGIKRFDMFTVNGLPKKYGSTDGFFQVESVEHIIENMSWKTVVSGRFRSYGVIQTNE